jgi:Na+-transporting NADH:ubiquinone oxidoreductase subunit F
MMPWLRKLHTWVGWIVGIQFVLWLASGLAMSIFDHHTVSGQHHRAKAAPAGPWPQQGLLAPAAVLSASTRPVETLETGWVFATPAYSLSGAGSKWLVDARTGQELKVGSDTILALARADYSGPGIAATPVWMKESGMEARRHKGPVWRVDFKDGEGTTLYLSAFDGRVLERRNDTWRMFDVAWMLHIMDYSGRENFNHPLLIIAASAGLWMAISGVWLLFFSFRFGQRLPRLQGRMRSR